VVHSLNAWLDKAILLADVKQNILVSQAILRRIGHLNSSNEKLVDSLELREMLTVTTYFPGILIL